MTKTGAAARPNVEIEPESLGETFELYKKQIIIGVLVVAAAGFGTWMWRRSAEIKEQRASEAHATAEQAFAIGNVGLAQPELERVMTRYAGTTGGTQSAMLLAQILYDTGKHAEGIAHLQRVLGDSPRALRSGLHALIGAGQEASGQSADAAQSFEAAASATEIQSEKDGYQLSAARNKVAAGDIAGARAIYEEIVGREDSDYAGEARVRLGELTGKA
jgi:predicted negative regulator of RcsB-dependent stress response